MPRWTSEARKIQAQKIQQWKPWQNSTGPKTAEGKGRVSQNALKHGLRSAELIDSQRKASQELRELRSLLKDLEQSTKDLDNECRSQEAITQDEQLQNYLKQLDKMLGKLEKN